MKYPTTPDGHYFVVRGRLWRRSNPALPEADRAEHVRQLMAARRGLGKARKTGDPSLSAEARRQVQAAKEALGERGTVWWTDGTPDYNRKMAVNTPYRAWYEALPALP